MYNKPKEYHKLYTQHYGIKINKSKQNRHIAGHKTLKSTSSYFDNDVETLQKVLDEKAGTCDIIITKGRLLEVIQDNRLNGRDYSFKTQAFTKTNMAKIHYSKTGHHIVPYFDYSEDDKK
ncbi:MAG: polymorphic toxin type 50 domain-containing protein [Treponemataceae bacterium]